MRAVTFPRYGDYTQLFITDSSERPTPASDEILIRVSSSSLTRGDWHYVHGEPFPLRFMAGGLFTPKRNIPGFDAAGIIDSVGIDVVGYEPGQRVMADLSASGAGGWAQYTRCKAAHVTLCPEGLSDTMAATIPVTGVTALQGLRDHAGLCAGERLLVKGATGGVGTFAVLIGCIMGADVTAVGSSRKSGWLAQLGADRVIHHDETDLLSIDEQYDVIFDAAAYQPFSSMSSILGPHGRYLMVGGSMKQFINISLFGALRSRRGGRSYQSFLQAASAQDMLTIAHWITQGELSLPAPREYSMLQASDAMRSMEEREITGKAVLSMG